MSNEEIGVEKIRHPAKFRSEFIEITIGMLLSKVWSPYQEIRNLDPFNVLDPFAGIGGVYELDNHPALRCQITAIEIEEEWSEQYVGNLYNRTIVHMDCIEWMKARIEYLEGPRVPDTHRYKFKFRAIVTSPCYGNRMADKLIEDGTRRNTYANALGRNLTKGNSGSLQWGDKYRDFHTEAWKLAVELLNPGGLFILNIKDHIRNGVQQYVSNWHKNTLEDLGMEYDHHVMIPVRGLQQGRNGELRVPYEWAILFRKTG